VEKGQLGTESQHRFIFIWEGTLAHLPEARPTRDLEWLNRKLKRWDRALSLWEIHDLAIKWLWSIMTRTDMRVDVCVTTRPAPFALALARKMEAENWPVRYVFAHTAAGLGRMLPHMPDVDRVYYGLEEQRWIYGPNGTFFNEKQPHYL
jgi:hypothetical protein